MKLNIEEKLVSASLISILCAGVVIIFFTAKGTQALTERIDSVYTDVVLPLIDIQEMRKSIHGIESELQDSLTTEGAAKERSFLAIKKNEMSLESIISQYEKKDTINSEPSIQSLLKKIGALGDLNKQEQEELKLLKEYASKIHQGLIKVEQQLNQKQNLHEYYEVEMKPLFDSMERISDNLMAIQLEQAKYSNQEGVEYASNLSKRIVTAILVSIVAIAVFVFLLSRNIISPLRQIILSLIKYSSQLKSTSTDLKTAAADQAEQTILAIKLSQDTSKNIKHSETMDALYAIDESSKHFGISAIEVGDTCEKLNILTKDLYKVIGVNSESILHKQ
jgi:hypothetical protein